MSQKRNNSRLHPVHRTQRTLSLLASSCVVTLAMLPSTGSWAAADDLAICAQEIPESVISTCKAVIDASERSSAEKVQAHISRGNGYFKMGNYDQALQDYDEAIGLDPSNTAALYNRGNIKTAVGQYDKAVADYSKAIQLNPTYAAAFNNRCFAYNAAGYYDLAENDCRRAINLDPKQNPKQTNAYLGLGNALNNKAEHDKSLYSESLQAYDDAIKWDANNAKAFLGRCSVDIKTSKFDSAIENCSQAIKLQPNDPIGWNNRCWSRAVVGQFQPALEDCNQALKLQLNDPFSRDSRAFAYLKMGQFDQAIADYDQALQLQPRRTTSLYGRGIAKLKKGDVTGGNEDINAAKREDPSIVEQFRAYGLP